MYLDKLAIDLQTMRKVTKPLTSSMLRSGLFMDPAMGALDVARRVPRGDMRLGPVVISSRLAGAMGALVPAEMHSLASKLHNTVLHGGGTTKTLAPHIPAVRAASPQSKELIDRLGIMHEGFEQAVMKRPSWIPRPWLTHADPEVILREGNVLASIPQEHSAVKGLFRNIRGPNEVEAIRQVMPSYVHGQTRLSSKAVKKLAPIIARRTREMNMNLYRTLLTSTGKPPAQVEAVLQQMFG